MLPSAVLSEICACLVEMRYPAGALIVSEGDEADRVFLVADGRVEASIKQKAGTIALAALGPGEVFGESALVKPVGRRTATVAALTPALLLTLDAEVFDQLLDQNPDCRAALSTAADVALTAQFLKQATPFSTLDQTRREALAARLSHRQFPAGAEVIRAGEPGMSCYLVRSGTLEVDVMNPDAKHRHAVKLGPGTLFGEIALLIDTPRTASVRALEACELLELRRDDLLEVIDADRDLGTRLVELVHLRARPRRADGILVQQRTNPDGETITILKDPARGAYFRLSPAGWFIWQRLDGKHAVRDLSIDYLTTFKSFAPHTVAAVVAGLDAAGFLGGVALCPDLFRATQHMSRWDRAMLQARRILEWRTAVRNVDGTLTRLYSGGVHWLYTWPAQVLIALIATVGLIAFFLDSERAGTFAAPASGALVLLLYPAFFVGILIHEAGHAFTTKAFGREVSSLGIGWYWFGPIAYVDTSDMWLADRWPRVAVSLAGPYATILVGGVFAVAGWLATEVAVAAVLWQFALGCYLGVLVNLNPLLEYDGYYVLIDLVDRPNLRAQAFSWLRGQSFATLRAPALARSHWLELVFGVAAILYVLVNAVLVVVLYRMLVRDKLAQALPSELADGLAWMLSAAIVILAASSLLGELRGVRARPDPSG
jgi:putative peptide zinc metalloprotease protein